MLIIFWICVVLTSSHRTNVSTTDPTAYVSPTAGYAVTFAGNGQRGPAGDGSPVGNTTTMDGPMEVLFNPYAGELYVTEKRGCRVRSISWTTGIVTTLIGSSTSSDCVFLPAPLGMALHLHRLYVVTTGTSTIHVFDLSNHILEPFAGNGTYGSTYNVPATEAMLNNPMRADEHEGSLYFTAAALLFGDGGLSRIDLLTTIVVSVANIKYANGLCVLRNTAYVTRFEFFAIYEVDLINGSYTVFLGNETDSGDSIDPGAERFEFLNDLAFDCSRKYLFIAQQGYVKRYHFAAKQMEILMGQGVSMYNGPGPMNGSLYNVGYPQSVRPVSGDLFVTDEQQNRIHVYGLDGPTEAWCGKITISDSYSQQMRAETSATLSKKFATRTESISLDPPIDMAWVSSVVTVVLNMTVIEFQWRHQKFEESVGWYGKVITRTVRTVVKPNISEDPSGPCMVTLYFPNTFGASGAGNMDRFVWMQALSQNFTINSTFRVLAWTIPPYVPPPPVSASTFATIVTVSLCSVIGLAFCVCLVTSWWYLGPSKEGFVTNAPLSSFSSMSSLEGEGVREGPSATTSTSKKTVFSPVVVQAELQEQLLSSPERHEDDHEMDLF